MGRNDSYGQQSHTPDSDAPPAHSGPKRSGLSTDSTDAYADESASA